MIFYIKTDLDSMPSINPFYKEASATKWVNKNFPKLLQKHFLRHWRV